MLNRIILMGRLTKDPELRATSKGTPVATFSLACERDIPSVDGTRKTDFIDVVAWRGNAEFVSKYFSKGRMAVVDGRLQFRDWVDDNGNKRRSTEIMTEHIYFGDSKKDGGDAENANKSYSTAPTAIFPGSATQAKSTFPLAEGFVDVEDDDLPF